MLGVTIILLVLLALSFPGCAEGGWRDLTGGKGKWTGSDNKWNLRFPNMNNGIWHYGPTRIWTTPVNSDQHEITSRVTMTAFQSGCGHVFKYKTGSRRTRSMVTKAWGYFLWDRKYLYIASNGKESYPTVNYNYRLGRWYNLKSVVNGTQVKIYIDNKLVKQVTMTGAGAASKTNNYVGLWCHVNTACKGENFKVKNLRAVRNRNLNNQLKCFSNHMQIKIPKTSLPFALAKDLRLNKPSCRATEDNKNFYLKTGFDQCGTKISKTTKTITYSNHVLGRPLKNSAVISRIHDINITISCSYPRQREMTSSHIQPDKTKYVSAFHSKGKFNFTLNLFPSSQFKKPYKKFPIELHLRQVIYVEVAVKSARKELSVLAQQCYATPSKKNGRGALKHWLIKNGCAMDSTLKYLRSPTKNLQRFSVQGFHFLGKHRHVYFHCNVIACNGNDAKSVCSRGCNKKKIGKRNAEGSDAAVMLSRGPLATRDNKIAEVLGHEIQPHSQDTMFTDRGTSLSGTQDDLQGKKG